MASDIISELSGIDSRLRTSSKAAASEICREGASLYNVVFDTALSSKGTLSLRCAEACARAAAKDPKIADARAGQTAAAIIKGADGELRYFLAAILIHVRVKKAEAKKCAAMLRVWLENEEGRGPKAAYLEAIAYLSGIDSGLKPMAAKLLNEALKSPVPSYSARARQIISGKHKFNY